MRAHCRPGQSSDSGSAGRSQKSKLWEPKGWIERASRGGGGIRKWSISHVFAVVSMDGRRGSFSHREFLSCDSGGLFPHSPPFDTSFLPRTSSRNITLSRYFPSNGTDRPRLREREFPKSPVDGRTDAERLRFDCGFEKWRKFVFFFGSAVQKGQFLIGRLFPERRGRRTRTRPSSSFIAIRWLPLERASSVRAERASCSKFQRGTHSRQPRLSEERDSGGRRLRAFILPKSFASASPRHVAWGETRDRSGRGLRRPERKSEYFPPLPPPLSPSLPPPLFSRDFDSDFARKEGRGE